MLTPLSYVVPDMKSAPWRMTDAELEACWEAIGVHKQQLRNTKPKTAEQYDRLEDSLRLLNQRLTDVLGEMEHRQNAPYEIRRRIRFSGRDKAGLKTPSWEPVPREAKIFLPIR